MFVTIRLCAVVIALLERTNRARGKFWAQHEHMDCFKTAHRVYSGFSQITLKSMILHSRVICPWCSDLTIVSRGDYFRRSSSRVEFLPGGRRSLLIHLCRNSHG